MEGDARLCGSKMCSAGLMNNLFTILISAAAAVFVIGAVAFRAAWMAPHIAKLGYLPKSWQRWVFGENNQSR
jgi:hypothetical protein